MATIAGTRFDEVDKFISIMGKASYKDKIDPEWENRGARLHIRDTPLEYSEREKEFDLSYEFVKDSWQYDSTEDLKKCIKPKLFIAGSRDDLVDKSVIQEIYDFSAEPKEMCVLESGHDYRKDDKLIEKVNDIIEKFLDE